jgi:phosphoserine aminotransferase
MNGARRPYNFSAGPACLPLPVLEQVAAEISNWQGCGMGVMEMSHRGPQFKTIIETAERDLRELLGVPEDFAVLFMQGGGLAENAIVPLNLARRGKIDVAVTGSWSAQSAREARRYADVQLAVDTGSDGYRAVPAMESWQIRADADYLHVCSNETIDGVEQHALPDLKALGLDLPLVVDCSSNQCSRPMDWSRIGLAFGGAQKNVGPAGVTLVFARRELLGHAQPHCPSAFDYAKVAAQGSMFNTPPTFGIYVCGLVFRWALGFEYAGLRGLAAIERHNIDKAALLYGFLDRSTLFRNEVAPAVRSRMNVHFFLREPALTDTCLQKAGAQGLLQLKGHKSKGGLRASLYNAMPLAGVRALVDFLQDFERHHG